MNETSNVQATGTPNSVAAIATPKAKPERKRKVALVPWVLGQTVPSVKGKASGVEVTTIGQDTGRVNKLGKPIYSKSLKIVTPTAKSVQRDGETLQAAGSRALEIGRAIKPAIMGRVNEAGADNAFIVRRYTETPGKRDRIGLTLERVNVENMAIKFAREYGLKLEEVYRKFPQLKPNKDKAINVTEV